VYSANIYDTISDSTHTQKAVKKIKIDPYWLSKSQGNGDLSIYTKIRYSKDSEPVIFDGEQLSVDATKIVFPDAPTANVPATIFKIDTDVANFHPCRYEQVIATVDGSSPQIVTIFNSQAVTDTDEILMPIIAGPRYGRAKIDLMLVGVETKDCFFVDKADKFHGNNNVIDLSKIEEAVVLEQEAAPSQEAVDRKPSILYKGAISGEVDSNREGFKDNNVYGKTASSNTDLTLAIPYKYGDENAIDLLKCIWPIAQRLGTAQQYSVKLQTCAFTRILNIQTYPDVKWVLQFAYDADLDKFKEMREKYRDYQLQTQYLDKKYKPKSIEEKIADLQDRENKYNKKAKKTRERIKSSWKRKKKQRFREIADKFKERAKAAKKKKKKLETKREVYNKVQKGLKPVEDHSAFDVERHLESGVADLILSLKAEYDSSAEGEYNERMELSASYQKIITTIQKGFELLEKVKSILDGDSEEPERKSVTKKVTKVQKELEELIDAVDREPVVFDFIPPSLAIVGSWWAVLPGNKLQNKPDIALELEVVAEPIVGVEMAVDLLALASKVHPVVKGIVAASDTLLSFADGEIRLDFIVTGEINASGKIKYNIDGEGITTPELKVEGVIEVALETSLSVSTSTFMGFGPKLGIEASASATTGISLKMYVEKDDIGIYLQPAVKFHGLTVRLDASIITKYDDKDNALENSDDGYASAEYDIVQNHMEDGEDAEDGGKEITLMPPTPEDKERLDTKWYIVS
ncbi:MAG: hypothetical protein ACK5IQ_06065, partial [Bacteroidales bacterium]